MASAKNETTITVLRVTRDKIKRLAQSEGVKLRWIVAKAIEEYEKGLLK